MTDTNSPSAAQEQKLQVINSNHKRLMELQKSLDEALDAFGRDASTLTQIATYWGQKPIWQRVGIGITVIVPLLALSIILQFAVLFTITFFVSTMFIGGDVLLTSHHQLLSRNTQKFKDIVSSLNSLQVSLIELTEELHEQFKQEVEALSNENLNLTDNVALLNQECLTLSSIIEQLRINEHRLKNLVITLESSVEQLKQSAEIQSDLYEQTFAQLETVRHEYEQNKIQLAEHIQKVTQVQAEVEADRTKTQKTIQILTKSVSSLSKVLTLGEEQRAAFEKNLTSYLDDNSQKFERVLEVLSQTSTQTAATTERFTDSTNDFRSLLNEQKRLFDKIETLVEQHNEAETSMLTPTAKLDIFPAQTPFGLFSEKSPALNPSQGEHRTAPEIAVH
ncbi:MAG: hypothetical protein LEGION0403_FIIPPAGN_00374 [Legionella sp.]|uniref:hypothetical protein n=1 Tax=Legionella sp. TaxID=459 RepID=UPI003D10B585